MTLIPAPQSFKPALTPAITRNLLVLFAGLLTTASFPAPAAAADAEEFAGEKVVHLLQEPRHRTVLHEGNLYLLDVRINAGDTSFAHTHDQAILLTTISTGEGLRDGSVRANIDYASEAVTHKVSNDGPGMMRIMALVNDGSGVTESGSYRAEGVNQEPQVENPWFRSYRFELAPGESTSLQTHHNPTAVIQANPGLVHISREDGITAELTQPGDWTWRKPESPFQITNKGNEPVAVVVNEGR